MFVTSSPPWLDSVRSLPRRGLYVLGVAAAALGFVALTRGKAVGTSGSALAYVEAIHHSVSPIALGRIDTLLVRLGQKVSNGEALVVMDGRELVAEREKATAQLAQLEAAVVAATEDEELQVTRSELRLLIARADEHGNRAELAEITQRMHRLDALLEQQMIPATQAEAARERQRQLAARVEMFDEAKARGQAGLGHVGPTDGDHGRAVSVHVEPARRAVLVQKAVLHQLELQIEQLTLYAPVEGVVTTLAHRPGEVVSAGTEIVSIVSNRPGVLIAELQEGMAAHVEVGQGVTVRPKELFARALHGRVLELAPEVDEVIPRARPSPGIPAWGRRITLQLDAGSEVLPGQAFNVALD